MAQLVSGGPQMGAAGVLVHISTHVPSSVAPSMSQHSEPTSQLSMPDVAEPKTWQTLPVPTVTASTGAHVVAFHVSRPPVSSQGMHLVPAGQSCTQRSHSMAGPRSNTGTMKPTPSLELSMPSLELPVPVVPESVVPPSLELLLDPESEELPEELLEELPEELPVDPESDESDDSDVAVGVVVPESAGVVVLESAGVVVVLPGVGSTGPLEVVGSGPVESVVEEVRSGRSTDGHPLSVSRALPRPMAIQ